MEDFYRQTGELMAEEMTDFGKMRGYLLDECDFMKHRQLSIEGSFIAHEESQPTGDNSLSILPKGNYICMTTARKSASQAVWRRWDLLPRSYMIH